MATIKDIKQDNNKALRYLHKNYGFDFQKPFVIIKQDGKFTANYVSIYLSKVITPFYPEDYQIVLLVRPYDYRNQLDRLHAVSCDGDKFTINVPSGYSYGIDDFYNKRDFEEKRKNRTAYYYIIAQKKEYLCLDHSVKIDYTERFEYIPRNSETFYDGKGNTYYGHITIAQKRTNTELFKYATKRKDLKELSDIIDKSGYLVCEYRSELHRRVAMYKNKKRKAEFLAMDYSGVVKELENKFDELKSEIAKAVMNITNGSQARFIEKAVDNLSWGLSYFAIYKQRIEEKYYDSREYAESSEKNIREYIDRAYKALRGAADETDGQ